MRNLAFSLLVLAGVAHADLHNGYQVHFNVNDSRFDGSASLANDGTGFARTVTARGAVVTVEANANQFTSAKASLTGSGSGFVKVGVSSVYTFTLTPPAGGASVKGGKLVLKVVLEGTATGDADLHLVTAVQSDAGKGTGSAVISSTTAQREEFEVVMPIAAFIEDIGKIGASVHQHLDATAKLGGSGSSVAEAKNTTRVTEFRVLNSAGAQVSGFTMVAAGGNVAEGKSTVTPPPTAAKVQAVEFYNAAFRHYFVSTNPAEIAKLDDGTFAGWTRTGLTFNVFAGAAAGLAPVCRFFTVAFPPTSSHFYAPRGLGCEGTLTDGKWQFEGDVFHAPLPNAAGVCPAGTVPVYRLYNNGRGGAPNHRFTTGDATRAQMLAEGFVAEGVGNGIGFCSPS
jgi:hypothetical protein